MFIWKGKGILVLPIAGGVWILGALLVEVRFGDDGYFGDHNWPLLSIAAATGVALGVFAKVYCSEDERSLIDEKTGDLVHIKPEHSLYFLKVRHWAILIPALYCLMVAFDSPSKGWPHAVLFTTALEEPFHATSQLFAADAISDGMYQRDVALSSDGDHFLY